MKIETKYGNLEILGEEGSIYKEWKGKKKKITKVRVKCHCGNEWIGRLTDLNRGKLQSCGCAHKKRKQFYKNPNYKHGLAHSKIERVYAGMNSRCKFDKNYVEKGIQVEWNNFEEFYKDMGDTYKEGLTIERLNVYGNYSKENCIWADVKTQANNTTRNIKIEIDGITKTMAQWCEDKGISYYMVRARIRRGWKKEDAILIPKLN